MDWRSSTSISWEPAQQSSYRNCLAICFQEPTAWPLRGNFSPKGPTGIANKDMGLILETAKKLGVVLPVGGLYQQLMLKALYNGWGLLDATVVMKIYQQLAEVAGEKRKPVRKKR